MHAAMPFFSILRPDDRFPTAPVLAAGPLDALAIYHRDGLMSRAVRLRNGRIEFRDRADQELAKALGSEQAHAGQPSRDHYGRDPGARRRWLRDGAVPQMSVRRKNVIQQNFVLLVNVIEFIWKSVAMEFLAAGDDNSVSILRYDLNRPGLAAC
jgi:hypothetical protein